MDKHSPTDKPWQAVRTEAVERLLDPCEQRPLQRGSLEDVRQVQHADEQRRDSEEDEEEAAWRRQLDRGQKDTEQNPVPPDHVV